MQVLSDLLRGFCASRPRLILYVPISSLETFFFLFSVNFVLLFLHVFFILYSLNPHLWPRVCLIGIRTFDWLIKIFSLSKNSCNFSLTCNIHHCTWFPWQCIAKQHKSFVYISLVHSWYTCRTRNRVGTLKRDNPADVGWFVAEVRFWLHWSAMLAFCRYLNWHSFVGSYIGVWWWCTEV